jgi:hypothetical protein
MPMPPVAPLPDITNVGGRSTLWVDSERIGESVAHYRTHSIDCLGVNPQRGFRLADLTFLTEFPDITDLTIVSPASCDFDLQPIRCLGSLRSLTVSAPTALSLGEFENLETARIGSHPGLSLIGCKRLKVLSLGAYRPKSRDLRELPPLPELRELELTRPGITSLEGISKHPLLRQLEVAYGGRLEKLSGLELLKEFTALHLYSCKRVQGIEQLASLTGLRSLRLNSCGSIPSIGFLSGMSALEEFRFVNTNIEDGDLRPLLRLKWVGFLAKKGYSHTPEQLDEVLREKGGGAIPRLE